MEKKRRNKAADDAAGRKVKQAGRGRARRELTAGTSADKARATGDGAAGSMVRKV